MRFSVSVGASAQGQSRPGEGDPDAGRLVSVASLGDRQQQQPHK